MRHPLPALVACLAALLLGLSAAGGTFATAGAVSLVVLVACLGWPQLLGAPARTSLSVVLAASGLVATWLVALWPLQEGGRIVLLQPIAVTIALGSMAAFVVQLVRGQGRPYRLESTAGTVAGVVGVSSAAGWTAMIRWQELTGGAAGFLQVGLALSLGVAALCGLVPGPRLLGRVLGVVLAAAAPWALAGLWSLVPSWPSLPQLPMAVAAVGGALAGLTTVLMGSLAPAATGRPTGFRAALALGIAPVAFSGLLAYLVLRIMPV